MQDEHGMAGVRFWMSWLALVICCLIVRHSRIGLVIVGIATAVWVAFAIRYLIRRRRAGAILLADEIDIDLVLCVAALALTAMVPIVLLALRLHLRSRQPLPLILAVAVLSAAWRGWSRRRKV